MVDLTADELDVLHRISEKPDLQPFFFKKVKGLKWFNVLAEAGYFCPENIPKTVAAKEEGYVKIPYWPATEYLVKASKELAAEENKEYASKFLASRWQTQAKYYHNAEQRRTSAHSDVSIPISSALSGDIFFRRLVWKSLLSPADVVAVYASVASRRPHHLARNPVEIILVVQRDMRQIMHRNCHSPL